MPQTHKSKAAQSLHHRNKVDTHRHAILANMRG